MFANDVQCGAMTYRREQDALVGGMALPVVRRRELRDRDSQGQGRLLPLYIRNRTSFPDRKMSQNVTVCGCRWRRTQTSNGGNRDVPDGGGCTASADVALCVLARRQRCDSRNQQHEHAAETCRKRGQQYRHLFLQLKIFYLA